MNIYIAIFKFNTYQADMDEALPWTFRKRIDLKWFMAGVDLMYNTLIIMAFRDDWIMTL